MRSRGDALILNPTASRRGWHRLQLAAECLQKFAWTYRVPAEDGDGYKKKDRKWTPAFARGNLIHLALAQHYARMKELQQGSDPNKWVYPDEAVDLMGRKDKILKWAEHVVPTFNVYERHYIDDMDTWEVIEPETLKETTFMNGKWLLTGRLDLVVREPDGLIYGVDHKSSARLTKKQTEFYPMSGQLIGYGHMLREQYGDEYGGFILNLVQVGPDPKFHRLKLPRSPNLEARFERIVSDIEEAIVRLDEEGRPYDDWPKATNEMTCFGRYGPCPFLSQCRFGKGSGTAGNFTVSDDW